MDNEEAEKHSDPDSDDEVEETTEAEVISNFFDNIGV